MFNFFFFNDTATTEIYTLSLHDALPICDLEEEIYMAPPPGVSGTEGLVCRLWKGLYGLKQSARAWNQRLTGRSEEHTSELQSQSNLVCRLLLEKKKISITHSHSRYRCTV